MNVGDIISSVFILIGLAGLALALLVKVLTKLYRQYAVYYEYTSGRSSYDIVKAFSKSGAAKKVPEFVAGAVVDEYRTITKVVRCREER